MLSMLFNLIPILNDFFRSTQARDMSPNLHKWQNKHNKPWNISVCNVSESVCVSDKSRLRGERGERPGNVSLDDCWHCFNSVWYQTPVVCLNLWAQGVLTSQRFSKYTNIKHDYPWRIKITFMSAMLIYCCFHTWVSNITHITRLKKSPRLNDGQTNCLMIWYRRYGFADKI